MQLCRRIAAVAFLNHNDRGPYCRELEWFNLVSVFLVLSPIFLSDFVFQFCSPILVSNFLALKLGFVFAEYYPVSATKSVDSTARELHDHLACRAPLKTENIKIKVDTIRWIKSPVLNAFTALDLPTEIDQQRPIRQRFTAKDLRAEIHRQRSAGLHAYMQRAAPTFEVYITQSQSRRVLWATERERCSGSVDPMRIPNKYWFSITEYSMDILRDILRDILQTFSCTPFVLCLRSSILQDTVSRI